MFIVANGNNCIYIHSVLSLANKATLNTKAKEIKNTIPDTTSFITTPEFSRFTKLSFEARIKEGTKSLTSKSEAKNAFDLGDKNTEKIKKKTSNICFKLYLLIEVTLVIMDHKII